MEQQKDLYFQVNTEHDISTQTSPNFLSPTLNRSNLSFSEDFPQIQIQNKFTYKKKQKYRSIDPKVIQRAFERKILDQKRNNQSFMQVHTQGNEEGDIDVQLLKINEKQNKKGCLNNIQRLFIDERNKNNTIKRNKYMSQQADAEEMFNSFSLAKSQQIKLKKCPDLQKLFQQSQQLFNSVENDDNQAENQ